MLGLVGTWSGCLGRRAERAKIFDPPKVSWLGQPRPSLLKVRLGLGLGLVLGLVKMSWLDGAAGIGCPVVERVLEC